MKIGNKESDSTKRIRTNLSVPQQKFAENLVKGMKKREAYIAAFGPMKPLSASTKASELLRENPDITDLMDELRQQARVGLDIGVIDLVKKLERAYVIAEEKGDARSMVKVVDSMATLLGLPAKEEDTQEEVPILVSDEILAKIKESRLKAEYLDSLELPEDNMV
jgi:hypothetical protein